MRPGVLLLLSLLACPAFGGLASLLREGKALYEQGEFRQAAQRYEKASAGVLDPGEREILLFNAATCLAADSDHVEAAERFAAVQVASGDPTLRARSSYNRGTCLVQAAIKAEASDSASALQLYAEAIQDLRNAMQEAGTMPDAAHNLELAMVRRARLAEEQEDDSEEDSPEQEEGDSGDPGEEDGEELEDYDESPDYNEDAELFDPGEPLGDFSDYEEIRGVPPPNQSEMDILAEELQNQQQRKRKSGAYRDVERDW